MLVDILLIKPYQGVSAGQCTQVDPDTAQTLVSQGFAENLSEEKQTKVETKKVGK